MTIYTIPNIDNGTDKTITITKGEAWWIKVYLPEVELDLVGWLKNVYPADLIATITGDLRDVSGVTQATRTRLKKRQLIHTDTDPMSLKASLLRWHLTPLLQEQLDATRSNVLGAENFIEIKLDRTGTVWQIAPLYFNQFRQRLIHLAPSVPKKPKLPALKSSPDWSFTPATA